MKILYLGILAIMLSGCATPVPTKEQPTADMLRAYNATNLLNISIGMNKQEVLEIMGTGMIQTYYYGSLSNTLIRDKVISNPYKSEI